MQRASESIIRCVVPVRFPGAFLRRSGRRVVTVVIDPFTDLACAVLAIRRSAIRRPWNRTGCPDMPPP